MKWEEFASKVQSVSKIGLKFSHDPYAIENYEELEALSKEMLNQCVETPIERNMYSKDIYPTPNVSVRMLVFNELGQCLFVQESLDGLWSVPGGWCDVFYSPSENGEREVLQEAGITVKADRCLGIFQREKYRDKTSLVSEYVLYFSANYQGGELITNHETMDAGFFDLDAMPTLSTKNTQAEINKALEAYNVEGLIKFD